MRYVKGSHEILPGCLVVLNSQGLAVPFGQAGIFTPKFIGVSVRESATFSNSSEVSVAKEGTFHFKMIVPQYALQTVTQLLGHEVMGVDPTTVKLKDAQGVCVGTIVDIKSNDESGFLAEIRINNHTV